MTNPKYKRRDFAFLFIQHIENNGGIDAVIDRLPESDDYAARSLIRTVYETAKGNDVISYKQYFSALGTLVHFEII